MLKPRNWFALLPSTTRRVLLSLGITTLAFVVFSLATIGDLLAPKNIQEWIVNPIPVILGILGCVATFLAWKGKIRPASYLMIAAVYVGFLVIATVSQQTAYSTVGELVIVVIPIMIAIQSFSEREFTWMVILAIVGRSAIQITSTFKSASPLLGASAQTALIAQWASIIVAILFGLYIAFNLNTYAFRVKLILVLGILTIIPTALLTTISRSNLESNLIGQADQSLVASSGQLASAVDSFIQTHLDSVRVDAQSPALVTYIAEPITGSTSIIGLFPWGGTETEKAAASALGAMVKNDPINIISCKILDPTGLIQISTNLGEIGKTAATEDFFTVPQKNGLPFMSPVIVAGTGKGIIHFSAIIRTPAGINNGVLDIVYSASVLQQIIIRNSNKLGTNVDAMLLDENNIVLAHSATPDLVYKVINPPDTGTLTNLINTNRLENLKPEQLSVQMEGLTSGLRNISRIPYFSGNFSPQQSQSANVNSAPDQAAASELSTMKWFMVTFVPQNTLLAPVQKQTQSVILISILISLVSIAIALGLTQVLISPILSLTRTSEQITQGDLNASAQVTTQDEIGKLAMTFNSMTARLRELVGSLEQRVADRTQALERRAVQLQAAADVGSTAARLRDLPELMRQVTRLISQRFGFYHVGIFLLDERGEYAVLRAANSEGGQGMLARGHKLKVGQVGIVGYVTGTGQARIALNVGEDSAFFNNPDLPTTQSEMALPLIVGGKILGALDIQSSQAAAFSQEDISTLKVLADQIAIAIENARLFSENQVALEMAQRAYGNISTQGWQRLLRERMDSVGFVSLVEGQAVPVSENSSSGLQKAIQTGQNVLENNGTVLHVPVKIRGLSIGALRMEKPAGSATWTPEAIAMADALSVQLSAALDSARLYTEIRQRADREFLISEITSKLGSSIRLDSILRTAVEELGNALGDSEITLQVGGQTRRGNERE
jgi:GAF domain-containing protein/HAMP domain-containing protein